MRESVAIPPFLVTRRTLDQLFGSPRLVQRMIASSWLEVVRQGGPGRKTLFSFESSQRAFERLKAGEEPPLLPCERHKNLVQSSGGTLSSSPTG